MYRYGNILNLSSMLHSNVLIDSYYFLCHNACPNCRIKKWPFIKRALHPKFQLSNNIFSHENSLGVPELPISLHNHIIVLHRSDDLISSSCIPILIRVLRSISRFHGPKDYNLPLTDPCPLPKFDHPDAWYQASISGHSTARQLPSSPPRP